MQISPESANACSRALLDQLRLGYAPSVARANQDDAGLEGVARVVVEVHQQVAGVSLRVVDQHGAGVGGQPAVALVGVGPPGRVLDAAALQTKRSQG